MKTWITIIFFLCFSTLLSAQEIVLSSLSSGGTSSEVQEMNLCWNLGEISVEHYSSGNWMLSQGFYQNVDILLKEEVIPHEIPFQIYPNPTIDQLIFNIEPGILTGAIILVSDQLGRKLMTKTVSDFPFSLDVSSLDKGTYIVNIFELQHRLVASYKIIKSEK